MINESFNLGKLPDNWKTAYIIPIIKADKEASSVDSYRPISLLSCVGKLMEKMTCRRVYWLAENNNMLSKNQSGYRKRTSIYEQIALLENFIRNTLINKEVGVTVFVDLKGAFDSVEHNLLIHKLAVKGFKGKLLNWLEDFLKNRKFHILLNGENSSEGTIHRGVPQSSALSPILYNLFTSDIPLMIDTLRTEYADDIALSVRGKNMEESTRKMEVSLDLLAQYEESSGLSISYSKTKAMVFTKKQINDLPLYINNNIIEYTSEYKYLGMVLDSPHLSWRSHIQNIRTKCIKRINTLKAVSHHHWGADRSTLAMMYRALVLNKINFGAEFYTTASETDLKILDVMQNECLRIITGCRKTSPINALEVETNFPPLSIQRKELVLKYYNRLRHVPVNIMPHSLLENIEQQVTNNWNRCSKPPLVVRADNLLQELDIEKFDCTQQTLGEVFAPWEREVEVNVSMQEEPIEILNSVAIQNLFRELFIEKYRNTTFIYTDVSKTDTPNRVGAAMVVPSLEFQESWKLPPYFSIFTAECYALYQALIWVNAQGEQRNFLLLTDSLSGVLAIQNRIPDIAVYMIQLQLKKLMEKKQNITIAWIPGHKGINKQTDWQSRH